MLYPGHILAALVRGLDVRRIAVLTPAAEQCDDQRARWRHVAPEVVVEAATPYGAQPALEHAAAAVAAAGVELVVMDCLGYTQDMKRAVARATMRPVLLARSCLARVAAELLA